MLRATTLAALAPAAALTSIGCSVDDAPTAAATSPAAPGSAASPGPRVLLAHFSRAGENYSYGGRTDLEVGNTEVLAGMIAERIPCDVHRIEAAEAYPESYDDTVERNTQEQDDDARPALAQPVPDASAYDVVLLGSPIWNVRPPMIMNTFAEGLDLTGVRVLPFVTFAVSGLGSTQRVYASALPGAELGEGLAVRGETVRDAGPELDAWLEGNGLLSA